MERVLSPAPQILLVEQDHALQSLLRELLELEGYGVSAVRSVEEVSAHLALETFALVLANVSVGRLTAGSFAPAHRLRRMVAPTPVGLLMTLPIPLEQMGAGFAFVQPLPFDLEDLLARVAEALQQPLELEHLQQVQIVERFFTAREDDNWPTLLALCTEDVRCYPLGPSQGAPGRRIQGLVALRQHLTSAVHAVHGQTFLHFQYAALPKGLIVRYVRLWTTPEGDLRRQAKIALFHFYGTRICQVGIRSLVSQRRAEAQSG